MGQISLQWEPWEFSNFSALRAYLIMNSESMRIPCPIIGGKKDVYGNIIGEPIQIGEETQYFFKDRIDVVVMQYNNGSGKLIVVGEGDLDPRFNELEKILGFERLKKS